MDSSSTKDRNVYGESASKTRELTEAELDVVNGGVSGIGALLAVCQAKSNQANQDAL